MRHALVVALALALAASAAAQECPPCECVCPPTSSENPERLVTGSRQITVGAGGPPVPLVAGPFVVESIDSTCPVLFVVLDQAGVGTPVGTGSQSLARTFVPAGSVLAVATGSGFCQGVAKFSGFRP